MFQCEVLGGSDATVKAKTHSTSEALRFRAVPGQGPFSRLPKNRPRQPPNTYLVFLSELAASLLLSPLTSNNDLGPRGRRLSRLRPMCPLSKGFPLAFLDHELVNGASNVHRRIPLHKKRTWSAYLAGEL